MGWQDKNQFVQDKNGFVRQNISAFRQVEFKHDLRKVIKAVEVAVMVAAQTGKTR